MPVLDPFQSALYQRLQAFESNHWIIPKRLPRLKFPQPLSLIAMIICMATISWTSVAQGSTPGQTAGDGSGHSLAIAIGGSIILGLILRYVIRSPSQQPQKPQLDTYQIAYLAGGVSRVIDLAITRLVHQGYLRPHVPDRTFVIEKPLAPEAPVLEQQMLRYAHRTPHLTHLRQVCFYEMIRQIRQTRSLQDIQQVHIYKTFVLLQKSLVQEKLLMTGWAAFIGTSFPLVLVLTILGAILMAAAGSHLNIPLSVMNLLAVLSLSIGIVTLCCYVPGLQTRWGIQVLADIRNTHNTYDVMQRFALFGYRTLSGGVLDDLKQMFQAKDTEATSGGYGC